MQDHGGLLEVEHHACGVVLRTRVAGRHADLARTVLHVMTNDPQDEVLARLAARTPVAWGFSEAIPRPVDEGYAIVSPDFRLDPPKLRDDLTVMLDVRCATQLVCAAAHVNPVWTYAAERVVLAEGWRDAEELLMFRDQPTHGDSGWFVTPRGLKPPEGGWQADDLESLAAWELLRDRPEVVAALALPPGYRAHVVPGWIVQIVDPHGTDIADNIEVGLGPG